VDVFKEQTEREQCKEGFEQETKRKISKRETKIKVGISY
jgi:hypothetical protein